MERQNLNRPHERSQNDPIDQRLLEKIENHEYAMALHYFHYNFIRRHSTPELPRP